MEKETQRTLKLLTEIEKDQYINQRTLSSKLGIALGLTNAYIKRCVKKGYIKISNVTQKKIKYLLTPEGFTEKAHLTYQYFQYTLHFYKETRSKTSKSFYLLSNSGVKNIIFYGAGELAEISYLSLKETNLNLIGVLDDFKYGLDFFGHLIMKRNKIKNLHFDKVIITSFRSSDKIYNSLLENNINKEKIFLIQ